jgi:hypothetical protein
MYLEILSEDQVKTIVRKFDYGKTKWMIFLVDLLNVEYEIIDLINNQFHIYLALYLRLFSWMRQKL